VSLAATRNWQISARNHDSSHRFPPVFPARHCRLRIATNQVTPLGLAPPTTHPVESWDVLAVQFLTAHAPAVISEQAEQHLASAVGALGTQVAAIFGLTVIDDDPPILSGDYGDLLFWISDFDALVAFFRNVPKSARIFTNRFPLLKTRTSKRTGLFALDRRHYLCRTDCY
jgi:hypothetical protein